MTPKELAERLRETDPDAIQSLAAILEVLGTEPALHLVDAAESIEASGGLLKRYKPETRSVGGVFFFLVSQHPVGRAWSIARGFAGGWRIGKNQYSTGPRTLGPMEADKDLEKGPRFTWDDRLQFTTDPKGEVKSVKITVSGKPGQITRADGFVATVLSEKAPPALPKGLPSPPAAPTEYMVFISTKQWRKVEEALADPTDQLIVEGWCTLDIEAERIAVFAMSATTQGLLRKARLARESAPPAAETT